MITAFSDSREQHSGEFAGLQSTVIWREWEAIAWRAIQNY
jgi:hypothetical protein